MAAGSIVVDLLLKTGSFETDTARASKALKQLKADADKIGTGLGLAFTGAAAGLGYLVKSSIDAEDHLNDLSKKTGIAADTLGGIGFAAQQSGLDLDSVAAGAGKLNKSLAEAAAGNADAAEAFKVLGISATDAAGHTKSADVALAEIADRFAAAEDGPEKAAIALRLFGKAGADMIPLLDEGGDALRKNVDYFKRYSGVTSETAAQADQFNDTLTKLKLLSGAFGKTLTAELLPSLQGLANLFLDNKENGDQFRGVAGDLADVLKVAAFSAGAAAIGFLTLGKSIGGALAAADAARHFHFEEAFNISKETLADIGTAKDRIAALYDAINKGREVTDYSHEGRNHPAAKGNLGRLTGDKSAGQGQDDFSRLMKQALGLDAVAKAALEAGADFLTLTDAQKDAAKIAEDYAAGLLKLTPAQLVTLDATLKTASAHEKQVDALRRDVEWTREAADANAAFVESLQHARDAYSDQTKVALDQLNAFGKTELQLRDLEAARLRDLAAIKLQKAAQADDAFLTDVADSYRSQAAAILATAHATEKLTKLQQDAGAAVGAFFNQYSSDANNAAKQAQDFASHAVSGLEDSLTAFLSTGKGGFHALVDSMIAEINRLYVVKPLLASIFGTTGTNGALGSALSGVSGFSGLSSLIGSSGNVQGIGDKYNGAGGLLGLFSGFFADGGFVPPNTWGVAGERGPEPVYGGKTGMTVQPAGGGGGTTQHINVNVTASPGMSRATAQQQGAEIGLGIQRALARNA